MVRLNGLLQLKERESQIWPKCQTNKPASGLEHPAVLASKPPFSVSEVEFLYELFKKLSSSVVKDGLIHTRKEELQLALLQNSSKNLLKSDPVIIHQPCGRSLFSEYNYDIKPLCVKKKLKEMVLVLALLNESDLILSDDIVEMIVDKKFMEADRKAYGRIDEEEWKEYIADNPSLLKNMTLPYLMDISLAFPSFVLNSKPEESQLNTYVEAYMLFGKVLLTKDERGCSSQ